MTSEQTSSVYTEVLVKVAGELVECRGHLEALIEDAALALDAHDLGPVDEPVQVLLWQQGATDAELLRPLLEQRVHHLDTHARTGRFQAGVISAIY